MQLNNWNESTGLHCIALFVSHQRLFSLYKTIKFFSVKVDIRINTNDPVNRGRSVNHIMSEKIEKMNEFLQGHNFSRIVSLNL